MFCSASMQGQGHNHPSVSPQQASRSVHGKQPTWLSSPFFSWTPSSFASFLKLVFFRSSVAPAALAGMLETGGGRSG